MNNNERTSLLDDIKENENPDLQSVAPQNSQSQPQNQDQTDKLEDISSQNEIVESVDNLEKVDTKRVDDERTDSPITSYTDNSIDSKISTQLSKLSGSSLASLSNSLKDEIDATSISSSIGSESSTETESSQLNQITNDTKIKTSNRQHIRYNPVNDSSTDTVELQDIPEYDKNRPLTKRERAIIKEQKKNLSQQKAYTSIYKFSWKNLSFLLCYCLISITGFFYPFNTFERSMQSELGIIPCNVSFILSCGTGCFFIFGGYYGIFYDRYGCSWGLYIGAVLSFIGNMCLSASFQNIINNDMVQLSFQSATVSAGYGMIYITCLLVILKSAANRHRGKVNGFAQALWMMGSYSTPKFSGIVYKAIIVVNATNEGEMVLFRGIWTALLVVIGAFLIKEEQSKWYFHRDYKYKPYFKTKYNKHFTMKQFKDIQFLCFLAMGSCMLCACHLYPSQINLILGSFNERSYASIYKRTISYLAAASSLITGIGIDLLKWNQRPAIFMFVAIFIILIANSMLIFNMYS